MVICVKGGLFSKMIYERIRKQCTDGVKAMFTGSTKQSLVGSQILHIKRIWMNFKEDFIISNLLLDE